MWVAREDMAGGALMVNGDTVHPPSVEGLCWPRADRTSCSRSTRKTLGEEEMKVLLDADGNLAKITKLMDPASAHGEYIGVSLIEPSALPALTGRCKRPSNATRICTTRMATRRSSIAAAGSVPPIPVGTSWVEVDDHRDLDRAREIACLY